MIAKVKETGKIIELINDEKLTMWDYARGIYGDTHGNKYHYKELEFIERPHKNIDWEQRRYEIAKDILAATYDYRMDGKPYVKVAVGVADALIEELKKNKM